VFKLAVVEPRAPSGPKEAEAEIRRLTAEIAAVMEQWVREEPRQWRWIHWRWRSRPDGFEETYRRADVAACFRDGAPARLRAEFDAGD
jgi:hypothetical protein